MPISRRSFVLRSSAFAVAGSMSSVIASVPSRARAFGPAVGAKGYGELVPDPRGILDLPHGFQYRMFSREGDSLSSGSPVPSSHDGMAAFSAGLLGNWLVRNHELELEDLEEDNLTAVPHLKGRVYDPEAVGGTTTLLVSHFRTLLRHDVSLAGTANNCAGGPTPWQTWLTCEETTETLAKPHGYVFEVDPLFGGNIQPIKAMGRFEHEAVAFARNGTAYLTEDAGEPHGCFYRFVPKRPLAGRGSLHAGGRLTALKVDGITTDLSVVQEPGLVLPAAWVPIANVDPGDSDTSVREQAIGAGATPIMKAEGTWTGLDGSIWFVSSRADGPDAEDQEDITAAAHSGQIWRYDPRREQLELTALIPTGSTFDGPDNITVSPHGFALACTDGEDEQWLVGITESGEMFPFGFNALDDGEFAGATFSPDGRTLYVNLQGPPGITFAIWGPWHRPLR